jgi:hypothetical protein
LAAATAIESLTCQVFRRTSYLQLGSSSRFIQNGGACSTASSRLRTLRQAAINSSRCHAITSLICAAWVERQVHANWSRFLDCQQPIASAHFPSSNQFTKMPCFQLTSYLQLRSSGRFMQIGGAFLTASSRLRTLPGSATCFWRTRLLRGSRGTLTCELSSMNTWTCT